MVPHISVNTSVWVPLRGLHTRACNYTSFSFLDPGGNKRHVLANSSFQLVKNRIIQFVGSFNRVKKINILFKKLILMKRFYIAERFSFDLDDKTEDNQIVDDDLSTLSKKYNYFPKTKKELQNLVDELIEERGNEADLNDIYTGDITDMSELFKYRSGFNGDKFNGDISGWDGSNVENMYHMFFGCWEFNGDISQWDVSNVKDTHGMFGGCKSFNQDISGWDVSSVEDMSAMFTCCYIFNQDISGWDVSNVENMEKMFSRCEKFNQDLSGWDVSNVENMSYMFSYCSSFNQDISCWDVSKVKNMSAMFAGCKKFNQDISGWDVSKVKYMSYMFYECEKFNQDISGWDVSSIEDIEWMFSIFKGCSLPEEKQPKFKNL